MVRCCEGHRTQRSPDSRLMAGVIYRHVAGLAEKHPEIAGGDTSPSIDYLERSLRADPDHLPAVLKLIGLYRTEGQDKDWHRLAEDAAQRFPQQSAILLQAVDLAIARKAYKKAVGFARRILAIDPINQAVRQRMIELQITHARRQARSKRVIWPGRSSPMRVSGSGRMLQAEGCASIRASSPGSLGMPRTPKRGCAAAWNWPAVVSSAGSLPRLSTPE